MKELSKQQRVNKYRKKVGALLGAYIGDVRLKSSPIISKRHVMKKRSPSYHSTTKRKPSTNSRVRFINPKQSDSEERDRGSTSSSSSPNGVTKRKVAVKKRKSIERKPTPYKIIRPSTSRNQTLQQIPIRYDTTSDESEISSEELFVPSLSESLERNGRIKRKRISENSSEDSSTSSLSDCNTIKQTMRSNGIKNREWIRKNLNTEETELLCKEEMNPPQLDFLLEESDAENSEDLEFDLQSTRSTSILDTDVEEYESSQSLEEAEDENIDIKDEIVGTPEYFHLKTKLAIVLHNDSKLYLHGLTSIKVLYGSIEILGSTLTVSSAAAEVYSPRGSSFLYFETKTKSVSSPIPEDLYNTLRRAGMDSQVGKDLCNNLEPTSAVLLCQGINKPEIRFLEKYTSQQVFPKDAIMSPRCIFQNKISEWSVFQPNLQWDSLPAINAQTKLFICGGKSVGKSTMLRYTINKLLLEHSEILVIDLDPGQPEFTVSGCISATIVNKPIFGPNYTHLKKPTRCIFVPDINISHQPEAYIKNVQELILSCSDLPTIPTLINYMGYTRGLGFELFSAVVAYAQPTCLVEIQSRSRQRNFKKQLTYEVICEGAKLFAGAVDFIPQFEISTIESMADANEGWHLEPRQIREMSVLSYLGRNLAEDVLSLTDVRVLLFQINLEEIKIICDGKLVDPCVVNAKLVALCSASVSGSSYDCHGWGVVRGINLLTNQLCLVTPLSPEELESVDCVILGSVSLPPSVYMTADNCTGLVPYVAQGQLTTLAQIPKRSHLPPKK